MSSNIIHFPPDAVTVNHGQPITTSLKVAEAFGKRHANVIRDIKKLEGPRKFIELNFEPNGYLDPIGRRLPMYEMTKDGFLFLVMGFNGRMAAEFKVAFIERFNEMEQTLRANAILPANSRLAKIRRYLGLGLSRTEIAVLCGCSARTVGREIRRLGACGLLQNDRRSVL